MTYQLRSTRHFERALRAFRRKHPQLRGRVGRVLQDLENDPHQPRLNLHRLQGSMRQYHAVRIDYDNRIVLMLQVSEREIILHDIGSHDEVYR